MSKLKTFTVTCGGCYNKFDMLAVTKDELEMNQIDCGCGKKATPLGVYSLDKEPETTEF